MSQLILVRHGQSIWNAENRFTGWTDVDLSPAGIAEAQRVAQLLRSERIKVDIAYTSWLKRAIRTLWLVLDGMDQMWIPQKSTWRLNERHYGTLQGMNKLEAARQLGLEELHSIRRGYRTAPPPVLHSDPRFPARDPRYSSLPVGALPVGESLERTRSRVLPYWKLEIAPRLRSDATVLVVAHGNSLRALVMEIEKLGEFEVENCEIATGIPLLYELDRQLSITSSRLLLPLGPLHGQEGSSGPVLRT
jgi:2,3-bisphosphoglycerate-dependent phosphoglycerate mutase